MRNVQALIEALDRRPDLVQMKFVVKRTVEGREEILCQPMVLAINRSTSSVQIVNQDETVTIEVTPHGIRGDEPTRVSEFPRGTGKR